MPTMRKKPGPRGPRPADVHRYARLSRPRNGAVRAVTKKKAASTPSASAPRIPFDGERQTFVCLYLHLITSEHPRADIAQEFFRCYEHLLEGGSLDSLPIQLISKEQFLAELAKLKAGSALLLDDEPTGETEKHEPQQHHRDRPR